jgi:HIV Tat-specific factor 1
MSAEASSSTSTAAADAMAAAFAADPRVHFSKASGKWEYEDEDGREFEWSDFAKNWVPIVSDHAAYR